MTEFDTTLFDNDSAVIFAVDPSLKIIYCNTAWDRFALENGGELVVRARQIGSDLAAVIPGPLQDFYARAFDGVRETGATWTHDYECSSPDVFRKFQMRVSPAWPNDREAPLVVVNSVLLEAPHTRLGLEALEEVYRDSDGIVIMCCHCRRTRRASTNIWDWVPQFVRGMPARVSHGLCDSCTVIHYGAAGQSASQAIS